MERREVEIVQDGPTGPVRLSVGGVEINATGLSWQWDPTDRLGLAEIELPPQKIRLLTMAEFEIPGEKELIGAVEFALEALNGGSPTEVERARRLLAGGLDEYLGNPNIQVRGQGNADVEIRRRGQA